MPRSDGPDSSFDLPSEMTVEDAIRTAVGVLREGHFELAEQLLRRVLDAAPDHPDALHYLGMILCDLGRSAEGTPMIERSLALVPDLADWHSNYGIACVRRDALDTAAQAFRTALDLSSGAHVVARFNLGITERLRGNTEAAEAHYRAAIAARPDFGDARYSLAALLASRGDHVESLKELEAARSAGAPDNLRNLAALGIGYRRARQFDKALDVYRRWAALDPDNAVPAYYLTALTKGAAPPDRAPDAYVSATFDSFATSFDAVLSKLGYRAPQMIATALEKVRPTRDGALDILDAGAGTGLCGPLLRPWAATLTGVDLSPKMLLRAKDRDCYDRLETAELTAFMKDRPGAYDVIVSADTLCYFGALAEVLAAAATALRPGGHLLFSVEEIRDAADTDTFVLQPHGRYAHKVEYVGDMLARAGLDRVAVERETLRREGSDEVPGMVVTAQRPA